MKKLQAADLRIGNNVKQGKIISFYENGIHVGMGKCFKFNEAEPIPITEELLLRFGYHCVNKISMVYKKYHNEENADYSLLILKEVGNNPIWVYSANNRWTINPFTIEIHFINELQNLFFCLSGKELTFKD